MCIYRRNIVGEHDCLDNLSKIGALMKQAKKDSKHEHEITKDKQWLLSKNSLESMQAMIAGTYNNNDNNNNELLNNVIDGEIISQQEFDVMKSAIKKEMDNTFINDNASICSEPGQNNYFQKANNNNTMDSGVEVIKDNKPMIMPDVDVNEKKEDEQSGNQKSILTDEAMVFIIGIITYKQQLEQGNGVEFNNIEATVSQLFRNIDSVNLKQRLQELVNQKFIVNYGETQFKVNLQ